MPVSRLTEEELANARMLVPAECVGLLKCVDAMAAELKGRRASDVKTIPALSETERAALTTLFHFVYRDVSVTNEQFSAIKHGLDVLHGLLGPGLLLASEGGS